MQSWDLYLTFARALKDICARSGRSRRIAAASTTIRSTNGPIRAVGLLMYVRPLRAPQRPPRGAPPERAAGRHPPPRRAHRRRRSLLGWRRIPEIGAPGAARGRPPRRRGGRRRGLVPGAGGPDGSRWWSSGVVRRRRGRGGEGDGGGGRRGRGCGAGGGGGDGSAGEWRPLEWS
ncbi:hypothetical protein PVAP13_2NG116930, partial [Panicum virgatum]